MTKSLMLGALVFVASCATRATVPVVEPVKPTPTTNVVVVEESPKARTDLPAGWVEIRDTNWSYGLPVGFDKVRSDHKLLALHSSAVSGLTISLDKEETDKNDLFDYVAAWLYSTEASSNKRAIEIRQKETSDTNIIAVQLLWQTDENKYASSVDFFTEKNNNVYHMSCSSQDIDNLKKYSNVCFEAMDTFQVK